MTNALQWGRDHVGAWIRNRRAAAAARNTWWQAGTSAELGELTARWLEGTLPGHPAYGGTEPDEETTSLVPALAAANRAGFVTDVSQPGADELAADGGQWRQRAAVSGYIADEDLVNALTRAAADAGLWFVLHAPASSDSGRHTSAGGDDGYRYGEAMTVTTRDGRPCTGFGNRHAEHQTRFSYGRWCTAYAVDELVDSYHLTLIDPRWGRNDLLWSTLIAALPTTEKRLADQVDRHTREDSR